MSTTLSASDVFPALSSALAALAERVSPAIVQVHGRPRRPASAVVVARERVVTTAHSVETDAVRVRAADGAVFPADVAGEDRGSDLVLLRVPGLPAAPLAFAASPPRLADLAVLIGRSWRGVQQARLTMISGISGPLPTMTGSRLDRVLQLPTSVYAGFSGSAILNPDGTLAGIATAGLLRGTALALPASLVEPVARTLDERGTIHRGYLGVATQPVRLTARQQASAGRRDGLLVMNVAAGSPADTAGVLVGDAILSVAGEAVDGPEELLAWLGPERVGQAVEVRVTRGDQPITLSVKVGRRPSGG